VRAPVTADPGNDDVLRFSEGRLDLLGLMPSLDAIGARSRDSRIRPYRSGR
jgi:hypothetical protein